MTELAHLREKPIRTILDLLDTAQMTQTALAADLGIKLYQLDHIRQMNRVPAKHRAAVCRYFKITDGQLRALNDGGKRTLTAKGAKDDAEAD